MNDHIKDSTTERRPKSNSSSDGGSLPVADQRQPHPSGWTLFLPFRGPIIGTHFDLLVPVHAGAGRSEDEQFFGEVAPGVAVGGVEAAVVRFAAGDGEFDVRLSDAVEVGAGVRAVDAAALLVDELGLDGLEVGIVETTRSLDCLPPALAD